jgi:hypothetical protein
MSHPAHNIVLEIGGARHELRATFHISCAIEERFGPILDVGDKIITGKMGIREMAELFQLVLPDLSEDQIAAHFDEVGIGGIMTELSTVMARIVRGWKHLSEEAEASAGDAPLEKTTRRGRPKGARNKPKDTSPGKTLSEAPAGSASSPANSGELPLTSSPASGAQPVPPQQETLPQFPEAPVSQATQAAAPLNSATKPECLASSEGCQGTV